MFLCPRRAKTFRSPYEDLSSHLSACDEMLYLLVDGAIGQALLADLIADGAEVISLFPDNADQELRDIAPRLVRCRNDQAILDRFHGFWGRGMASILISGAARDTLVQHLKGNLYVEDPDGEFCILRFHDPRVLCRLSEVFVEDQIDDFLGHVIKRFLFEGPAGEVRQISRDDEVAQ